MLDTGRAVQLPGLGGAARVAVAAWLRRGSRLRYSTRPMASPQPTVPAEAPTLARLLALAWPVIISRATQTVIGLSDAIMVAPLGEEAVAATTTGGSNAFNVFILPMGIVFIVQSFASQLHGRGDAAGARRYGWYGLAVALMTEVLCLAVLAAVRPGVTALGYAPGVREGMVEYLVWRLPSGGAAIGLEALANYYGGLGNTRLPMLAALLAMVLNVGGNWLFILGHAGFPALGVRGAALASSLSTLLAFAVLFACFWFDLGGEPARARVALRWRELGRTLRFGIPSGLNWFLEMLAFTFFINVVLGSMGTTALAAFMAVLQASSVAFMPSFALMSAGAILVGQAIGRGVHAHARRAVRLTLVLTCSWQGSMAVLALLVPRLVLSPFAPAGAEARFLALGAQMLVVVAAWQVFDATAGTFAESLRAAGDTQFTLWARVIIAWVFFVPGVLLARRLFDLSSVGVTTFVVAYSALLAATLAWRYRSGAWERIELVPEGGGAG